MAAGIDFGAVEKSVVVPREGERPFKFPSRDDYLQHLVQLGLVSGEDEFRVRPDLVLAVHSDWHKQGQQGCHFAQFLGQDPPANDWGRIVIPGRSGEESAEQEWTKLNVQIDDAIRRPTPQALSLLFPGATTPQDLCSAVNALVRYCGWDLEEKELVPAAGGEALVAIGLRARVEITPAERSYLCLTG